MAGVLEVLTHRNVGDEVDGGKHMLALGYMATGFAPLSSDEVHFSGQIVAVVIAETFETARDAAQSLVIEYDAERPTATFGCEGTEEVPARSTNESKLSTGHFARALASADVVVGQWYETPAQHHNPLELFQTTCAWQGDDLTVWESSQNVRGYQHGLAQQLDTTAAHVRVLSPFVGGAFGSRGELAQSTALIALAARRLGRPVKLVASRQQCFTLRTFRAETRHHVRLGADRDGRLVALGHEGWELTSRDDRFAVGGIESTARLYACPNIEARVHNLTADRQTPGFMRAPPETPYLFALESAMDELSYALGLDPIELRRRNETSHEPIKGLPFSSRSLLACYDAASEAFGWHRRDPRPGAMRDGAWRVGWGCAASMYPTQIAPCSCRVTLGVSGRVVVETASQDIGTGLYTIVAQTAADRLGVPVDHIEVRLGDSDLPAAPLSAGSNTTASVTSVVVKACEALRERLAHDAVRAASSPVHGLDPASVRLFDGRLGVASGASEPLVEAVRRAGEGADLVIETSNNPDGAPALVGPLIIGQGRAMLVSATTGHKDRVQFAFGAQMVEVRVHERTGEIRVPRVVGAFAAGRIMNPRTARSQLTGAQIWGLSAALHEATEIDPRTARYTNADLAEYLVPVQADVAEITTIFVPEEDNLVNPLGVKGLGELGNTGLNAAVANAVYHATGVRRRQLPIRPEHLLPALQGHLR